jgi:hypothetical protein
MGKGAEQAQVTQKFSAGPIVEIVFGDIPRRDRNTQTIAPTARRAILLHTL